MSDWHTVLRRPEELRDSENLHPWFQRIAQTLLNELNFVAADRPHRFTEIEFYYHGDGHPDLFTHRDPIQLENGRWYFHRTGGVYRSGSFKGMDLSFGDGTAHGGVLIRGIETPDGTLIDGPSLCADHLIAQTKTGTVAALDSQIDGRPCWDSSNLLRLEKADPPRNHTLYTSARVGLTLKYVSSDRNSKPQYIVRPYRFLSGPGRIKKGKTYLVLALHAQGKSAEEISKITGTPKKSVQKYIEDFEAGKTEADLTRYFGAELGTGELCRLHGTCHALTKPVA